MMSGQARGDVLQSPYVVRFDDYLQRAITITVNFDNATRSIIGAVVVRDTGCLWTHLLIGIGVDGTPDSTPRKVDVPEGTTNVGKQAFTNFGVDTIEQFQAFQITAGL